MSVVSVPCKSCKDFIPLEASESSWVWFELGALVQDAFPDMSPSERELLVSGICGDCFDAMFE